MLSSGNKKEEERDEGPFSIELESDKYCPGDTVKGTLIIVANRAFLAQRLELYVIGYERIVIPKDNARREFSKKISYKAEMPPESVAEDSSWDRIITCWLYHEDLCSFVPYNPIEIPATTTKNS